MTSFGGRMLSTRMATLISSLTKSTMPKFTFNRTSAFGYPSLKDASLGISQCIMMVEEQEIFSGAG